MAAHDSGRVTTPTTNFNRAKESLTTLQRVGGLWSEQREAARFIINLLGRSRDDRVQYSIRVRTNARPTQQIVLCNGTISSEFDLSP